MSDPTMTDTEPRTLTRTCARCGARSGPGYETELHTDGTCYPCAIAYRDEIIDEYRASEARATPGPAFDGSDDVDQARWDASQDYRDGWTHGLNSSYWRERREARATPGLREAVEASMNDIGLGTPERMDRARLRLLAWAEEFLNGLSFNEPALQRANWAQRRAPDLADSILAALAIQEPDHD